MKKNYLLLTGLILMASVGFSQGIVQSNQIDRGTPKLTVGDPEPIIKRAQQPKALGDTIFYEDFGTGTPTSLPAGWSVTNLSSVTTNAWIWSNTAPGGQYSTNTTALNSTTGSNGYMSLPCDLYNTPFPTGGPVAMDTWFTSPSFSISPQRGSVIIKYEQAMRYCCSTLNELVLEVSSDGVNWSVPYDAINGFGPNTVISNATVSEINVSPDLGYQSTGYLRFRSTGNSHYYWMIDDVLVYEGAANQLVLEDFDMKFHASYDITPIYRILPLVNVPAVVYQGMSYNAGANVQTNVDLNLDVIMDSTIGGGPGQGVVHSASASVGLSIPSQQRDTTDITNPFFSFNAGWYRNRLYITSDSVNQNPAGATDNYTFALTNDTVIALDRGPSFYVGSSGPPSYVGGGQDNDAAAALMILDSGVSVPVLSISVWPAIRTETDGLSISPRIWRFEEDSATLNAAVLTPPVGQSPFSTQIDTSNQGTWVTMPIFPPVILNAGAYYFGVEQTGGGSNGKELWLGRDQGQESLAPAFSNIFFLNEPGNARWIAPPRLLGIRFNGSFTTGITTETAEANVEFNVYPNPNNGLFTLKANSPKPTTYIMNVRNMVGQTVMSEAMNVNGNATRQIDLTSFEKGVYFVTLENGEERLVKKVVVK